MPTPTFNPHKLCPKYLKTTSENEKRYITFIMTRGINFLLAELWKQCPEEVAISTIPSWLYPYLNETLNSSTAKADSHFVNQFVYYKEIIESYLAKELLS